MALSSPYRAPRSAADRMDPQHNPASSHRVSRPILMSSWGALHRVFYNVLFLIVGFATMHVVFVGGQRAAAALVSPHEPAIGGPSGSTKDSEASVYSAERTYRHRLA